MMLRIHVQIEKNGIVTTAGMDHISGDRFCHITEHMPGADPDTTANRAIDKIKGAKGKDKLEAILASVPDVVSMAESTVDKDLVNDAGVQEAIQTNNLHLLNGLIEASNNLGMHTFDQYLTELLAAKVITEETARHYAVNKHKLDLALRGIVMSTPILTP